MTETKLKILTQGDVIIPDEVGYMLVGNNDAVCFYIDPRDKAYIEASSESPDGCPTIYLGTKGAKTLTEVEFVDFPGWRFHAGDGGKSIAIALVNKATDLS